MNTISIILLCVIASIFSAFLKEYNSTYALIVIIAAAVIAIACLISSFNDLISDIYSSVFDVGETVKYIKILIKAVGVCILAEMAGSVCKDSGNSSMAVCIDVCAKVIILALALPLIGYLVNIIQDLFNT